MNGIHTKELNLSDALINGLLYLQKVALGFQIWWPEQDCDMMQTQWIESSFVSSNEEERNKELIAQTQGNNERALSITATKNGMISDMGQNINDDRR